MQLYAVPFGISPSLFFYSMNCCKRTAQRHLRVCLLLQDEERGICEVNTATLVLFISNCFLIF